MCDMENTTYNRWKNAEKKQVWYLEYTMKCDILKVKTVNEYM